MTMSKLKLVGALSVLTFASAMGQPSCVQLNGTDLSSCQCADASLTFHIEGEKALTANTVNLAIVLDGSGSIDSGEFGEEQAFAEDTVAAFAARNLFGNNGTASYIQYSDKLVSSGTFTSVADFNAFAAADVEFRGGTKTSIGIDEGTALLGVNPASASIMIVITDGQSNSITDTVAAADAARAAGILVFAVGVGDGIGDAELIGIGGADTNVFEVDQFDLLDAALASILSSGGSSTIDCPSTNATVTIEFAVPVACSASGAVSGSTVTFSAPDLEGNETVFDVMLDLCSEALGGGVVVSATYTDDQGNTPDLSGLTGLVVGNDSCVSTTPPVTCIKQPAPTPCPTATIDAQPERGQGLLEGSASNSTYLGCYVDEAQFRTLNGPMSRSDYMTTQRCADSCSFWGYEFFGTAYASECHCGDSQPCYAGGVCDYECSGDSTTACGGVAHMSIYRSDIFVSP